MAVEAATLPPAAGSDLAPATPSSLTILPFRREAGAVEAACDEALSSWGRCRDPFTPSGLLLCARTRSTTDVFLIERRNPGAEESWDAGLTLAGHFGSVAARKPLAPQEPAAYPVGYWRAAQPQPSGFLLWYQTGELPESGSAQPALAALEHVYADALQPRVHVRALDAGRRVLVFDVWSGRIEAMRAYARVRRAMRRQRIPMAPGDAFPLLRLALA